MVGASNSSLTGPPPRRRARPSKIRHNNIRAAQRWIFRLSDLNPETFTEEQRRGLNWAKGVLAERDARLKTNVSDVQNVTFVSSTKQMGKRIRSPNDKPLPKKAKDGFGNAVPRSFSEVVKGSFVMAVVDKGDEYGTIPKNKWSLVKDLLAKVFFSVLEEMPGPPPSCRDAGWYQGRVKLVALADERSVELYKAAIGKLGEVWPGAKLDVVHKHDIPSRPRAHAWIPASSEDADSVLKMLRVCNPTLPTHNWKIGRFGEKEESSRQVVIILNDESLPLLAKSHGIVSYAFDQIQINVYRGDQKPIENSTNPAEVSSGEGLFEKVQSDLKPKTNVAESEEGSTEKEAVLSVPGGDISLEAKEDGGNLTSASVVAANVSGLLDSRLGELLENKEEDCDKTLVGMEEGDVNNVEVPSNQSTSR